MRAVERPMLLLGVLLGCWTAVAGAAEVTYLDQGWDEKLRQQFYFTPQGSRMIPVRWFMALETEKGDLLADADNLKQYGFIADEKDHPLNPHKLPIGFAVDPRDVRGRGFSLGLTCAACHTGNITVAGKVLRIDGGPANVDFDRFYSDLAASVTRTYFDEKRFERFADRVLPDASPVARGELRLEFADFHAGLRGDAVIRNPSLDSGFGRVDALTQIISALAVAGQREPANLVAVNAPTSYPHLWLAPQLEFVQWNPIAASPLARNGGEVLGVFGAVKLDGPKEEWYTSSLLIKELHALEQWVAALKPPKWDGKTFGRIDKDRAAAGKQLYKQHCQACHNAPPYERTDPAENLFGKTFIKIGRVNYKKAGTDPLYAEALLQRLVRTNETTREMHGGQRLVSAPSFFLNTVGPVIRRAMDDLKLTDQERAAFNGFRLRPPAVPGGLPRTYEPPSFADLKAGPLAGIWATGPFLHNGSVPTVYELLSPVEERRKVFFTGGRELDREKLGFFSGDAPERFRFDTSKPGNGNGGHVYPPQGLDKEERLAVIEFLKTLH
jgi:hypothetical protein